MWIELGIVRPGSTSQEKPPNIWINTDHIVRVEFVQDSNKPLTATVITTKPGGSDRSVFTGDDAERIKLSLQEQRIWCPKLDFEQN
jgi:hypothetical protein